MKHSMNVLSATGAGAAFALLMLGLCACSGDRGSRLSAAQPEAGAAAPPAGISFPRPSQLPRSTSGGPEDYQRLIKGELFSAELSHENVSIGGGGPKVKISLGSTLTFTPSAAEGASGLAGAAFAAYQFQDANGYSGPTTLQYEWKVEPADYGQAFIALSNFVSDRWDWFPMEADGSVDIGDWDLYSKDEVGDHNCYVYVVLLGSQPAELDWVLQGGPAAYNMSLSTDLNDDPALNLAPLTVNFDCSYASVVGGSFAGFDWDFDDDGVFEVTNDQDGLESYTYTQPGEYRCVVVIKATDGHSEQAYEEFVAVNPANTPPVASIVPDTSMGDAPLPVHLDASASSDDGTIVLYEWDFDSDGDYELSGPGMDSVDFTFARYGVNTVTLRVTDNDFATDTAMVDITCGTGWRQTVISDTTQTYTQMSMCVVGNGPASRPSVVYQDGDNHDLFFAQATTSNGSTWAAPVAPVDNSPFLAGQSDVVFNPTAGVPELVYNEYTGSDYLLHFCRANNAQGTSWNAPLQIESGADLGASVALGIGAADKPMVACVRDGSSSGSGVLSFSVAADSNGSVWGPVVSIDSVPVNGFFGGIDLELIGGAPMITAGINGADYLHAGCYRALDAGGSDWAALQTLITSQYGRTTLQIALDRPALALGSQSSNSALLYLRANDSAGTDWPAQPQQLLPAGQGGTCTMAIVSGTPAICFKSVAGGVLKYIQAVDAEGASWFSPQTIEGSVDITDFSCLVNSNGHPVVVFGDYNGNLICAWFQT